MTIGSTTLWRAVYLLTVTEALGALFPDETLPRATEKQVESTSATNAQASRRAT